MTNNHSNNNQSQKPYPRPFDLSVMLSEQYSTRFTPTPSFVLFEGTVVTPAANKNIKK